MEWIGILISVIGAIGGIGGIVTIYHAKSNKDAIDINNFHALIEEERTERKLLRDDYEDYKITVEKRVAEVKEEVAQMRQQNQKMSAAIYSAYRCTYPKSIDECPVWQTYEKLDCAGCKMKVMQDMDMDNSIDKIEGFENEL